MKLREANPRKGQCPTIPHFPPNIAYYMGLSSINLRNTIFFPAKQYATDVTIQHITGESIWMQRCG